MTKRIVSLLLVLVILALALTGCREGKSQLETETALLEFPRLEWGSSPDAVRTAMDLTEDQILEDQQLEDLEDAWAIVAQDVSCFGVEAQYVKFQFNRYTDDGEYALTDILLFYPDDTDMTAIKQTLIETYGQGSDQQPLSYSFVDGALVSGNNEGTTLVAGSEKEGFDYYWVSSIGGKDRLSADGQEAVVSYLTQLDNQEISRETALEWLEKQPLVTLYCTDASFYGALTNGSSEYMTYNSLHFDAQQLVYLEQNFG